MVKYCIDKYPMGSFKGQRSAGKYMEQDLYKALQVIARQIVHDQTYLVFISSSTLEVGTGKSVLASQIGECLTEMINIQHDKDIPFNVNNVVFRPEKLIEVAPTLPKYSTIVLDEFDEKNYHDKAAIALRQFYRKCRQLNQIIVSIVPDFFQIPKGLAISRSFFFLDVKFKGEMKRGYFDFYSFKRKRDLYIKGKKTYNWSASKPNFHGRFTDGYAYTKEMYLEAKLKDLTESEVEVKLPTERDIKARVFKQVYDGLGDISIPKLATAFGISSRTGDRYLKGERERKEDEKTIEDKSPPSSRHDDIL